MSLPIGPLFRGSEQGVLHVAQKFDLHDVNLYNRYARNFCPSLVGVCVVVEEFIAQHQCDCEESVFTARLSFNSRIEFLQSVDEQEGEYYDILCDLSGREGCRDPFAEASRGNSVGNQGM